MVPISTQETAAAARNFKNKACCGLKDSRRSQENSIRLSIEYMQQYLPMDASACVSDTPNCSTARPAALDAPVDANGYLLLYATRPCSVPKGGAKKPPLQEKLSISHGLDVLSSPLDALND
jgi:hypothetical protein